MHFVLHYLYPLLYTVVLLLYFPVFLVRLLRGDQSWRPVWQRAGLLPRSLRELPPKDAPRVWIHSVSVGEANSLRPLVEQLGLSRDRLFISTTTETGQAVARHLYSEKSTVFFFPLDWKTSCRRYLRAVAPDLVILTETELWPSFIHCVRTARIPLLLLNGRISDRSFKRYQRIGFLTSWMLETFCKLGMQTREDRDRVVRLGGPSDRIHWIGNLKFDYSLPENPGASAAVRQVALALGQEKGHLIWVCGSTHEGEEAVLLDVFLALQKEFEHLRWVVAPRHPHRSDSVTRLLRASSLRVVRRSQLESCESIDPQVVVVDTIGELAHLYEIADLVFVGGSLTPVGGHNLIEPAHFKKPILFGPHMENFREISEVFLNSYGALQVQTAQELQNKMRELLRDASTRDWLGGNARRVIRDNQGAVRRAMELVHHCAPQVSRSGGGGQV